MTQKPKWTAGNWTVETWPAREGDEYKRPRLVVIADGAYLCELEDTLVDRAGHEEQVANAALIALAPEMAVLIEKIGAYGEGPRPIDQVGLALWILAREARAILARLGE